MFGFLRRWWAAPRRRGRDVFRYWDGAHRVGGDPLKLRAALDAACADWPQVVEELRSAERIAASGLTVAGGLAGELDRKRDRCHAKLIAAARRAFALAEYVEVDGRAAGLTDVEALDVLADYLVWVGEVMEDTRPLASPPPSTGSAAAPSPAGSGSASPSTPSGSPPSGSAASPPPSAPPCPAAAPPASEAAADVGRVPPSPADPRE
jgi:hypothetical protein